MLSGVEVIPADRLLGAAVLGLVLPHVAEVVALGDGDDHGQYCCLLPGLLAAELTMIIQMNATVCAAKDQGEEWVVQDHLHRQR